MKRPLLIGFAVLALGACSRRVVLPVEPLAARVSACQAPLPEHALASVPAQLPLLAQPALDLTPANPDTAVGRLYEQAYQELAKMLDGRYPLSFKRAVFLTENAYFDNKLDYKDFNALLAELARTCKTIEEGSRPYFLYEQSDKEQVLHNAVLFKLLTETTSFNSGRVLAPYRYDFEDFNGDADWRKMFVSKLLVTHSGNCHSLPFLYKILAEETGAQAWLALAPNHIYLKQHNQKDGWYNTELTSGTFPMDAWLMASGYISKETIVSGIYMDTLSARQNVVLCLVDLAKGYEHKRGPASESFVLKCTDLALHYFPHYINAQLLQAEALRIRFERLQKDAASAQQAYAAMNAAYTRIYKTGYREMPAQMYTDWLRSVQQAKTKYLTPIKP